MALSENAVEDRDSYNPVATVGSAGEHFVTLPSKQSINQATGCDEYGVHVI